MQQDAALTGTAAASDSPDGLVNGALSDKSLVNGWHQPLCVYEPADFSIAVGPIFNFITGTKFGYGSGVS